MSYIGVHPLTLFPSCSSEPPLPLCPFLHLASVVPPGSQINPALRKVSLEGNPLPEQSYHKLMGLDST